MMASRSLVVALIAFASTLCVNAQQVSFCGGGGYDVTSTMRDMSVLYNNYTWWINPCGTVTSDAYCASSAEAPLGAMVCQRGVNPLDTWVIANYNATVAARQSKWYAIPGGVIMETSNGDRCGNNFRTSVLEFQCEAGAISSYILSVVETETCWYHAVIRTASACRAVGPTVSNVVGSSFLSTTCGGGFYDFSSMRDRDVFFNDPGHDYYMRMCAYVTEEKCASVQPTSFCQLRDNSTVAYDLSDWNPVNPQLYTITPTGVDVMVKEGDMCGNQPRRVTYSLQCNPRARRAYISYVQEYRTCHYRAVIQTSAVCTGTNDPARGYCGGAGYSMARLAEADLTLLYNNYEWVLHPCGVISTWYSSACIGRDSMLCQSELDHSTEWSLASWNRNVSREATWIAIANGVQLYVANSGESCGGVIRDTTINFICNATAIQPWFASVTEPSVCGYVATVHTEYACDTVGSTADNSVGSSFWSDQCGGGVWDISQIRAQSGDLSWDSDQSGAKMGHMYYLELCGRVNNPDCDSVQPTMFCQRDKNSTATWSLSNHQFGAVQKYTVNTNGFTMSLQDGTPCGNLGNRTTDIQVVCDGSNPAIISSLREIETCHYVVIVRGRCRQGVTPAFDSSSSKLSGGAIAGIVIGSIVGALILIAILFVFCCGAGMSSMRNKKGTRRFDEEESNHQSEMEMESSTA